MPTKYRKNLKHIRKYKSYRKSRNVRSIVKQVLHKNVEMKFYEVNGSFTGAISNAWTGTQYLGAITPGTGPANRIGNKIRVTGFYFRGLLLGEQTGLATDQTYNQVRLVMLAADNGFVTANLPTGSINQVIDKSNCLDLDYKIYDKLFLLRSPGVDGVGFMPALKEVKIFKRMNSIINFKTGTNFPDKNFGMYTQSDSTVIPHPAFATTTLRIYFTDI
nr:MAG: capsid protein [Cressdnaviricota sp.]